MWKVLRPGLCYFRLQNICRFWFFIKRSSLKYELFFQFLGIPLDGIIADTIVKNVSIQVFYFNRVLSLECYTRLINGAY